MHGGGLADTGGGGGGNWKAPEDPSLVVGGTDDVSKNSNWVFELFDLSNTKLNCHIDSTMNTMGPNEDPSLVVGGSDDVSNNSCSAAYDTDNSFSDASWNI